MCGTPKTGYMIESMVAAVVHNIEDMINKKAPSNIPTWNAVCITITKPRGLTKPVATSAKLATASTPLKAGSNSVVRQKQAI
jgi:hypothetical protein